MCTNPIPEKLQGEDKEKRNNQSIIGEKEKDCDFVPFIGILNLHSIST